MWTTLSKEGSDNRNTYIGTSVHKNMSDFSYYTPHISKVKGEIEHFKKCLKSIQATLEIGYPAQGFEINIEPNIELTTHRRQRKWIHMLQEASDQLMELCTEQLEENIDYKEEKLKGIMASLTKLSGSETASTDFIKSVEANVLDKGVLNNGNNFSNTRSTINQRKSSTPYARHPPKQPKSKHNAQPQPLLNAQPLHNAQPFPFPRSINSANFPPFRPHFFSTSISKTLSKPSLDCTAAPELTWIKKLEACTSDSSEIPQNYNKTRPHHKTKDNKCNTRIIEENHTYQVKRAYEITNAN